MYCNPTLQFALHKAGIALADYQPAYGGESVGLDLFHASDTKVTVLPAGIKYMDNVSKTVHLSTKVSTGLHLSLPKGWGAFVFGRGSVTKTPLIHRAGVIDPGYTGEVFLNVVNISADDYVIEPYAKLPFQIVTFQTGLFSPVDATAYEALIAGAKRGEACIGSSDVIPPINQLVH